MPNVDKKALVAVAKFWLAILAFAGLGVIFGLLVAHFPLVAAIMVTLAFFSFISYVLYDVNRS